MEPVQEGDIVLDGFFATLRGILPSYWDYGPQPLIILVIVIVIFFLWRTPKP